MLAFMVTAAMVTLLQFQHHGCARPPTTRSRSVLDRMPQGLGKRDLPRLPRLLDDLRSRLVVEENPGHAEDNAFHSDKLSGKRFLDEEFHPRSSPHKGVQDLGSLLRRQGNQQESIQQLREGHLGSPAEDKKEEEDARLVLFYSLPRSSDKRGRRGWRPRGRRGKGWALGGKRQAVLDRMPLSYGKKREALKTSFEQGRPDGEGILPGVPAFRGKREVEDWLEPV